MTFIEAVRSMLKIFLIICTCVVLSALVPYMLTSWVMQGCQGKPPEVATYIIEKNSKTFEVQKATPDLLGSNITVVHFDGTVEVILPPYKYKEISR